MSFQWIFDNAESISINKRPIVSQTIARDQHVRSVSRGGAVWRFTVKMPTGMRWTDHRGYVENIDRLNISLSDTVTLSSAKFNWFTGYRGAASSTNTMTIKHTAAQAASDAYYFELGNMPGATGAVLFKPGDLIQPNGSTYVYSLPNFVYKGSQSTQLIRVNRPILDTPSDTAVTFKVGNEVTWTLICTQCPTYTLIERDIISWNGEFQFYEVL